MIKIDHVVLGSPEQYSFIIEGMRNPMNSWDKSDSGVDHEVELFEGFPMDEFYHFGENDRTLMARLSKAGTEHRKFMRMMPVYMRITAPLYWWKEFDTYKIGTVANSCSTMHKIHAKEFTREDFSTEHLNEHCLRVLDHVIEALNDARDFYNGRDFAGNKNDKRYWWQMIQLLPESYNQTRNIMTNYEVLANIYRTRKDHRLDEWRDLCEWIESLPLSEIITQEEMEEE